MNSFAEDLKDYYRWQGEVDGEAKGMAKGKAEGRAEGKVEIVHDYVVNIGPRTVSEVRSEVSRFNLTEELRERAIEEICRTLGLSAKQ